jgi:hypothetical protein
LHDITTAKAADVLNPVAVRRNTMGAYITASGIAFGLLAIWAALVPLVA